MRASLKVALVSAYCWGLCPAWITGVSFRKCFRGWRTFRGHHVTEADIRPVTLQPWELSTYPGHGALT